MSEEEKFEYIHKACYEYVMNDFEICLDFDLAFETLDLVYFLYLPISSISTINKSPIFYIFIYTNEH